MIYIREQSHALMLLQLLNVAGEFPASSLSMLGSERTLRELVLRMSRKQEVRIGWNGHAYDAQLLCVSGKRGAYRTIRLHRSALPLLNELHPDALSHYLHAFRNHAFTGKRGDIERNHRVAEAIAMMLVSGIEARPYALAALAASGRQITIPDTPSFYPAKTVKQQGSDAMNKTGFTRMAGMLMAPGLGYVVYNTRSNAMKWHGDGERKAMQQCEEVARRNAGVRDLRSAILLGHTGSAALTTLQAAAQRDGSAAFERIYEAIHFVPMQEEGRRMLSLLCIPELQAKLAAVLFPARMRIAGYADCDCDAMDNDKYILSHLDGDLARLLRFCRAAKEDAAHSYEVLAFPFQAEYVRAVAGVASLRCVALDKVTSALKQLS